MCSATISRPKQVDVDCIPAVSFDLLLRHETSVFARLTLLDTKSA